MSDSIPPTPRQQPLCAFPECTAFSGYGFREPGTANLAHRKPDAAEVWVCGGHREHGPQLLAAMVAAAEAEAAEAAARGPSLADLTLKARRAEGKLL